MGAGGCQSCRDWLWLNTPGVVNPTGHSGVFNCAGRMLGRCLVIVLSAIQRYTMWWSLAVFTNREARAPHYAGTCALGIDTIA